MASVEQVAEAAVLELAVLLVELLVDLAFWDSEG
jgi:hypothetical protein